MARMNKSGLPPQKKPMLAAIRQGGPPLPSTGIPKAKLNFGATAPHKTDLSQFKVKHGWPNLGQF